MGAHLSYQCGTNTWPVARSLGEVGLTCANIDLTTTTGRCHIVAVVLYHTLPMLRKDKFDPDRVRSAVDGASSAAEVLRRLDIRVHGENYKTLRRVCTEHRIALPIYDFTLSRSGGSLKPIDQYLVASSPIHNSRSIKRRLVEEKGIPNQCAKCGLGPLWDGEPLTLQLDHIDGVHDNNNIENLRLLCPNCHSQTSTFTGKNKNTGPRKNKPGSRRDFKECACGSKMALVSEQCIGCYRESRNGSPRPIWPPLDELSILVETHGPEEIGKRLGVTRSTVTRRLRSMRKVAEARASTGRPGQLPT